MRGDRVDGSKPLNTGLLQHRITWQQKTVSGQDSFGRDIFTWTDVITSQCQVMALGGKELEYAQQRWAEARFKIETHYGAMVERAMRGVWGERYLDVLDSEDPWGTRAVRRIVAKEWVE